MLDSCLGCVHAYFYFCAPLFTFHWFFSQFGGLSRVKGRIASVEAHLCGYTRITEERVSLPGQGSQCSGFGSSGLSKLFLYFIYLLWSSMKTFVLKRQGRAFCLWLGFRTLLGLYFSLLQIVWLGNWKW